MGRTVPTVRQLMNEEYQDWIKTARVLPHEERKVLKELLDAPLTRSDAGSMAPRPLPSETMFMLMLVHLETRIEKLEERARTQEARFAEERATFTGLLRPRATHFLAHSIIAAKPLSGSKGNRRPHVRHTQTAAWAPHGCIYLL